MTRKQGSSVLADTFLEKHSLRPILGGSHVDELVFPFVSDIKLIVTTGPWDKFYASFYGNSTDCLECP